MSATTSAYARRHPISVVTQARRYKDAGWSAAAIVRLFADDGITVSKRSVDRWTNPNIAESDRRREERRRRRKASERSGRLALHITNPTPEFKVARIRALREQAGMTRGQIAKVMRFDFGDEWLTEDQVRHALATGRYPKGPGA